LRLELDALLAVLEEIGDETQLERVQRADEGLDGHTAFDVGQRFDEGAEQRLLQQFALLELALQIVFVAGALVHVAPQAAQRKEDILVFAGLVHFGQCVQQHAKLYFEFHVLILYFVDFDHVGHHFLLDFGPRGLVHVVVDAVDDQLTQGGCGGHSDFGVLLVDGCD